MQPVSEIGHIPKGYSRHFTRAVEEAPLWEAIKRYSDLTTAWRKAVQQQIVPKTAAVIVTAANSVVNEQPDFPDAVAFRDRLPALEAIARRVDEKGDGIELKLRAQFSKPWISDLWIVDTQDGLQYFCREKPTVSSGTSTNLHYVADFDLSEKIAYLRSDHINNVAVAPQSALAIKALEILSHVQIQTEKFEPRWEQGFNDLVQDVYSEEHVDPLLRFILLQQTMDSGCQGSKFLQDSYAPQRKCLTDAAVNVFANWLDPADKEARAFCVLPFEPDGDSLTDTLVWQDGQHVADRQHELKVAVVLIVPPTR